MVEKRFEKLGMPDIERFENYLPTAFNSELTLLQKVNKIIFDLIETNKLTNEMIDYLNKFIETFDEKLYKTIDDILSKWVEDGVFEQIMTKVIDLHGLNVKWFGAIGDGVTDDTDAFYACFNTLPERDTLKIIIPEGTYVLSKPLYITRRIELMGYGVDRTFLEFCNSSTSNFPYNAFLNVAHQNNVNGLQPNSLILPDGWIGDYGNNAYIHDFTITETCHSGDHKNGVMINAPIRMNDVKVRKVTGNGFSLYGSARIGATINLGEFLTTGTLVKGNCNHTYLSRCFAQECGYHGFEMNGADANTFVLEQCLSFHNKGWGIFDDSMLGGVAIGCELDGNVMGGIKANAKRPSTTTWYGNYVETNHTINYDLPSKHIIIGYTGAEPEQKNNYITGVDSRGIFLGDSIILSENKQNAFNFGEDTTQLTNDRFALKVKDSTELFKIEKDGLGGDHVALRVGDSRGLLFPTKDQTNSIKKGYPYFPTGFTFGLESRFQVINGAPTKQKIIDLGLTSGDILFNVSATIGQPIIYKVILGGVNPKVGVLDIPLTTFTFE